MWNPIEKIKNRSRSREQIPSEQQKLSQLFLFKLFLIGPLFVAIVLIIYIIATSELKRLAGYEGVNNLVKIFQVPLALLASIGPLLAIVATNHRSGQAHRQMELLQRQNAFTNYLKHKEEFEVILSQLQDTHKIRFTDKLGLYGKLFPNNRPDYFDPVTQPLYRANFIRNLAIDYMRFLDVYITNFPESKNLPLGVSIYRTYLHILHLSQILGFKMDLGSTIGVKLEEGDKLSYLLADNVDPLKHAWVVGDIIRTLLIFGAEKNRPSVVLADFLDGKTKKIFQNYIYTVFEEYQGVLSPEVIVTLPE